MAKVSQLPMELWLEISRYLPKSQLVQLKSLNTFFFHRAMDIDWGQIAIDMMNPDQTSRVLSRMSDPFVASRTTRLSICLRKHRTVLMPSSKPKLPSIISNVIFQGRESTTLEFATLMTQLFNVLPLLHNLRFLKLELFLIPLNLIQDLFRAITTSPFTRTIQKLSLTGHSNVLAPLAERRNPETTFANLTALDITLIGYDNDDDPMCNFDTDKILSLARFMLSFSLQHLRIVSSYDVSPLFSRLTKPLNDPSSLAPLPNLKSVVLTPFNFTFRSSPQSVHRFLLVHSTNIQHLQLGLMMGPLQYRAEEPLEKWLSNFVNDCAFDSNNDLTTESSLFFPNLQTLDIHPPATPAGLSAVLVFIKRTAPTLSSLRIRCKLEIEGAKQVVSTLTKSEVTLSKLKSLQMDVSTINVAFIEFLARERPQLQKLYLKVYCYFTETLTQELFGLVLEHRWLFVDPEDDCLTSWKLGHLSIEGFSIDTVAALAACIPSVVLGSGQESEDEE